MENLKRILKLLKPHILRKIFDKSDLNEIEHKIMIYSFCQKQLRQWICNKLNISTSTYNNYRNIALTKVKNTLVVLLCLKE